MKKAAVTFEINFEWEICDIKGFFPVVVSFGRFRFFFYTLNASTFGCFLFVCFDRGVGVSKLESNGYLS